MMSSKKVNPGQKSNFAAILQKLNASAIRLGLPTLKLSPQQLIQHVKSLKNLPPPMQREKLKDLLMLMRYEKQISSLNPHKNLMQSSTLKILKQLDRLNGLGNRGVSNLVKNFQKLTVHTVKKILEIDNTKELKVNYYQLLDVLPSASLESITEAKNEKLKLANEKQREQINQAYEVLSSAQSRLEYDEYLTQHVDEVDDIEDTDIMLTEVLALSQRAIHELTPEEKAKQQEEFALLLQLVLSICMPRPSPKDLKSQATKLRPSTPELSERLATDVEDESLSLAQRDLFALSNALKTMRNENSWHCSILGFGLLETMVDACKESELLFKVVSALGGY